MNSGMETSRFLRFHPTLVFFEILIVFLPLISGLVICIETGSNHISLGNSIVLLQGLPTYLGLAGTLLVLM